MPTTLSKFSILKRVAFSALFCLAGCYQNHLFVHQERFDLTNLASIKVNTPDPRYDDPVCGQNLLIAWDFPRKLFNQKLTLEATVILWNLNEEKRLIPLARRHGTASLFFPSSNKIITYRMCVYTEDGLLVDTWEHHFWRSVIRIDEASFSVSAQPKQSSVTETP